MWVCVWRDVKITNQNLAIRSRRAYVVAGVLGWGWEPWLGLLPQHHFLLCVSLEEVVWLMQAPGLCLWSPGGLGVPYFSNRFYPAEQWFSKQGAQNKSINITRKLAGRVNTWVPPYIQWIRNSGSVAQECVFQYPLQMILMPVLKSENHQARPVIPTWANASLLSPTLETFLTVQIGGKGRVLLSSSG